MTRYTLHHEPVTPRTPLRSINTPLNRIDTASGLFSSLFQELISLTTLDYLTEVPLQQLLRLLYPTFRTNILYRRHLTSCSDILAREINILDTH